MEEFENLNIEELKNKLVFFLQEKRYIEFDKLLTYTSQKEKIGKIALKKEAQRLAEEAIKENVLYSLPHGMPSGYFIQNGAVFKEIKDGIAFVCEYCTVTEIHRTNDNEESLFTVLFHKDYKYITVKSEEFVDNKQLETILINHGVFLGDKLRDFKNYISGFIRVNAEIIPTVIRVNKTGWQEVLIKQGERVKQATRYCNPIIKPDLSYVDSISNKIYKEGDLTTATEILKNALLYKGSCISVLAGLASTLIKPLSTLGLSNFIVNYSGSTGKGKTLSCQIGLSLFGNGQENHENSLVHTMNSTAVGNEFLFSQYLDMPILLDEAGAINGSVEKKAQKVIEIIFQYFSGTGKTRGQKNLTLRKVERSRGVLFLTMEYDLRTIERQSGVTEKGYFRRTIEVDTTSGNFMPEKKIFDFSIINSCFGWIGEVFVNSIIDNSFAVLEQIKNDFLKFEKELSRTELRGKEKYFSVLYVVLEHLKRIELIGEFEYNKAIEILKLVYNENLETMTDITTNISQIWAENILEYVAINKGKFNEYSQEQWGKFHINKENVKELHIYPTVLSNFCVANGINERSFCKELFEKGAMVVEHLSSGSVRFKVKRANTPVFCFLVDKLEEISTSQKIAIEIHKSVESAKKYIALNDKGDLTNEKGEVLF